MSGLSVGVESPSADAQTQMLIEYLTGEGSGSEAVLSAQISRLFIVGNSLAPLAKVEPTTDGKSVSAFPLYK